MTVDFEYSIGDEIRVKPIGMLGKVDSMSLDANGIQYRIVYWNDSARISQWVYAWEIEAVKK